MQNRTDGSEQSIATKQHKEIENTEGGIWKI